LADTGFYYCEITNEDFPELTLKTQEIYVTKAYSVIFNVTDTLGNPLSDVTVKLSGYGDTLTNSDGKAVFNYVLEANNLIYFVEKDGYFSQAGKIDVHDNVNLNISLEPVSVKIYAYDQVGQPLKNANVFIRTLEDNNLVAWGITDSSGFFIYLPIKDGNYCLQIIQKPFRQLLDTFQIKRNNTALTEYAQFISTSPIQVYPVPVFHKFTIFAYEMLYDVQIRLYTLQGEIVYSEDFPQLRRFQVTMPKTKPGTYLLEVRSRRYHQVLPIVYFGQ
jgi:hypothetical protein